MKRIGFTGDEMTTAQQFVVTGILVAKKPEEFHHGDCVGADAEAHDLVREFLPECRIVVHPPDNPKSRAFRQGDVMRPERPYLSRDSDIVLESDMLVACPRGYQEVLRNGTWATIRRARAKKIPIWIVFPDGSLKTEEPHR